MIFFYTDLSDPTCVVEVSYECRTPPRVGHRDTPNHRGVRAS
jgi:hypothetical protein